MSTSPDEEHRAHLYLRSSLIAIRYERGRYVLFHPGSSSVTATDWLGARAARLLVRGYSNGEVARRVERDAVGAGERLRVLTTRLATIGAMTDVSPRRTLRWYARLAGSLSLGWVLSVFSSMLRMVPLWALHWLYETLPETPFGTRTVRQSFAWMDGNLRASGFADTSPQRRAEIARASGAASTRLSFFLYLCILLPAERFTQFLSQVIDVAGFEAMWRHVAQGGVVAGLHSDLFWGAPIYLRTRGVPVSSIADMFGLGVALASDLDIRSTFPALFPNMIDSRGVMTGKELLKRLRGGEVIMAAFDAPPQREVMGEVMPTIAFLGHSVRRFDGPAWLAVRSGKPLILVDMHRRGKRTVLDVMALERDGSLPAREQIAALTEQMYTQSEAFIRAHPESWMVWSYFHEFGARDVSEPEASNAVRTVVRGVEG